MINNIDIFKNLLSNKELIFLDLTCAKFFEKEIISSKENYNYYIRKILNIEYGAAIVSEGVFHFFSKEEIKNSGINLTGAIINEYDQKRSKYGAYSYNYGAYKYNYSKREGE